MEEWKVEQIGCWIVGVVVEKEGMEDCWGAARKVGEEVDVRAPPSMVPNIIYNITNFAINHCFMHTYKVKTLM